MESGAIKTPSGTTTKVKFRGLRAKMTVFSSFHLMTMTNFFTSPPFASSDTITTRFQLLTSTLPLKMTQTLSA